MWNWIFFSLSSHQNIKSDSRYQWTKGKKFWLKPQGLKPILENLLHNDLPQLERGKTKVRGKAKVHWKKKEEEKNMDQNIPEKKLQNTTRPQKNRNNSKTNWPRKNLISGSGQTLLLPPKDPHRRYHRTAKPWLSLDQSLADTEGTEKLFEDKIRRPRLTQVLWLATRNVLTRKAFDISHSGRGGRGGEGKKIYIFRIYKYIILYI